MTRLVNRQPERTGRILLALLPFVTFTPKGPLAWALLVLGMGLVGWGTYVGLKHVEAQKAGQGGARLSPSANLPTKPRTDFKL